MAEGEEDAGCDRQSQGRGAGVKAKVTWRCRCSRISRAFASECQMQTMVALMLLMLLLLMMLLLLLMMMLLLLLLLLMMMMLLLLLLLLLPLTSAGHARPQREQPQTRPAQTGAEWKSRTRIRCLCDVTCDV